MNERQRHISQRCQCANASGLRALSPIAPRVEAILAMPMGAQQSEQAALAHLLWREGGHDGDEFARGVAGSRDRVGEFGPPGQSPPRRPACQV